MKMPPDCFSRWRGDDGVVHAAAKMTYQHPYAGWWVAICGVDFLVERNRGARDEPTCIRCLVNEVHGKLWAP